MNVYAIISLSAYFFLMLGIGVYGYLNADKDVSGFMLGGRKLGPAVTALSAGASDMSGWMLLGLPGLIFLVGLDGGWIAVGLIIGAYLNYQLIAPRLRLYTEHLGDSVTIPEYLERRFDDTSRSIRILCSIVIIVFFAIYTTSGVVAGGKLFESSFGIDYQIGLMLTAGVVVAYSTFGGFLAVSTTDFVQGCIMMVALIIVPVVTVMNIGGLSALQFGTTSGVALPNEFSALAIFSALSWGLGYFGQPHIIVRFMAINNVSDIPTARRIGMSWMVVSIIGTVMVGLAGAAFVATNRITLNDPETIFILLANTLFHPLVSGFLLAAILAAIMSTISSQLLVASSSITEDIYYNVFRRNASESERLLVGRLSVVSVAALAVLLAQDRDNSILSLVSNAWAGFGASFGPVILISLFWGRMTKQGAIAGVFAGAITVLYWVYSSRTVNGLSLSDTLYEIVPGFVAATFSIIGISLMTKPNTILRDIHRDTNMNS